MTSWNRSSIGSSSDAVKINRNCNVCVPNYFMCDCRTNCSHIQHHLYHSYHQQKFLDCRFKIKNQEVKAHRLVLASSSVVFERMLYGEFPLEEVIVIDDVEPEHFAQTIEYLYSNIIEFTSVSHAWLIIYIAKKYLLNQLLNRCATYITNNVTLSTLVLTYEYAELFQLTTLQIRCMKDMVETVGGVFYNDYHMKPSTLRSLLENKLVIAKTHITEAIVKWATVQCDFKNYQVTAENIIKVLKDEDIIRFINSKWIVEEVCEICRDVLMGCTCLDETTHKTMLILSTLPRQAQDPIRLSRYSLINPSICKLRKVYKISQRMDLLDSEEFQSVISVDREMVITGISIVTQMNQSTVGCEVFKGYMRIRVVEDSQEFCRYFPKKNVATPTVLKCALPYNSQVFIPLSHPVPVRDGKVYTIAISYKNLTRDERSGIVCSFMCDTLEDCTRGHAKMNFFDFYGTIVRGVAYYPI